MYTKPRVLLTITSGKTGGAQQSVFNLANTLKKQGVDIVVGFGVGDFLKNKLESANISYYQFNWLKRSINPFSVFLFILEIKKFLDKEHFDTVHFNSTNALFGDKAMGGITMIDPNFQAITDAIKLVHISAISVEVDGTVDSETREKLRNAWPDWNLQFTQVDGKTLVSW